MKKLGIKIGSTSLFITSFLFLITQSIWASGDIVVMFWNGSSIASLIFALLATTTSGFVLASVFTKFRFGKKNRELTLMFVVSTLLMLILSFSLSIGHQCDARMVEGIKVYIPNVIFFTLGLIGYFTGEIIINKK